MILKIFLVTAILVTFLALAIGLKSIISPESKTDRLTCDSDEGSASDNAACGSCRVKELVKCSPEKQKRLQQTA
ncbi:MAG: hypothetical protein K9J33_12700 [Bacteroidales bacterium]|nr:hypothetical protein [Bacteroidales bacterium]